jgi:hypothetical protein
VIAIGKNINVNAFGQQLVERYSSLLESLEVKYGQPTSTYDELDDGSIWGDDRDWMMALYKKERKLINFWLKEKSQDGLMDDIQAISFSAAAISPEKGYLILGYEFNGAKHCIEESKYIRDKSL